MVGRVPIQLVVRLSFVLLVVVGLELMAGAALAGATSPAATQPATEVGNRTGSFVIAFNKRSRHSTRDEIVRRFSVKDKDVANYKTADFPFDIYVPEGYDGSKPFGLAVLLYLKGGGGDPVSLHHIFDDRQLIFLGLRKTGLPTWQQGALAMDAVFNAQQQLKIDPKRIYLLAWDHGNQIALDTADVFTGNMTFWSQDNPWPIRTRWDGQIMVFYSDVPLPPGTLMIDAKNRAQLRTSAPDDRPQDLRVQIIPFMKHEGFEHVELMTAAPRDVEYPMNPDWYDKAFGFLDFVTVHRPRPVASTAPAAPSPAEKSK